MISHASLWDAMRRGGAETAIECEDLATHDTWMHTPRALMERQAKLAKLDLRLPWDPGELKKSELDPQRCVFEWDWIFGTMSPNQTSHSDLHPRSNLVKQTWIFRAGPFSKDSWKQSSFLRARSVFKALRAQMPQNPRDSTHLPYIHC